MEILQFHLLTLFPIHAMQGMFQQNNMGPLGQMPMGMPGAGAMVIRQSPNATVSSRVQKIHMLLPFLSSRS